MRGFIRDGGSKRIPSSDNMTSNLGKTALPLIALLLAAAAFAQPAAASKTQMSVIEDPGRLFSSSSAQRAAALDETKALGADVVKVAVTWRSYAPDATSATKPAGDLADPGAYPSDTWSVLDEIIAGTEARGMKPWIMITAPAPRWAVSRESGRFLGNYQPDVDDYADFVSAVGRRYQSVHIFSFWNEPNIRRFMDPQTEHGIARSAIHYRDMYRAAYSAIRSVGHKGDTLLFGELMPRTPAKVDPNTTRPVPWLREFFCLDSKGRAYRGRTARRHHCTHFKKIYTSGLAYHPYRLSGGPLDRDTVSRDNAPINYLRRIERILDQAHKAGHLATKRLRIYNSEFGFQTDPPDVDAGTPIKRVPSYLNYSEYLSWLDSRVATYSQYQIIDDGDLAGFQTGLRFLDGEAKPGVYQAFQVPMVAMKTRSRNRVSIWGGVRVRSSNGTEVAIQYRSGDTWRTARTVRLGSKSRYFLKTIALSGAASKTWRLQAGDAASRSARAVTAPKPRRD